MTLLPPSVVRNFQRLLLSTISIVAGLSVTGCKHRPLWTQTYMGGEIFFREWEAYTTQDGHVLCVMYHDRSRPENFLIRTITNPEDSWIEVKGARLDLRRGQCLLITNGAKGEPLQMAVPWMTYESLGISEKNKHEDVMARINKLFEPLTPKP